MLAYVRAAFQRILDELPTTLHAHYQEIAVYSDQGSFLHDAEGCSYSILPCKEEFTIKYFKADAFLTCPSCLEDKMYEILTAAFMDDLADKAAYFLKDTTTPLKEQKYVALINMTTLYSYEVNFVPRMAYHLRAPAQNFLDSLRKLYSDFIIEFSDKPFTESTDPRTYCVIDVSSAACIPLQQIYALKEKIPTLSSLLRYTEAAAEGFLVLYGPESLFTTRIEESQFTAVFTGKAPDLKELRTLVSEDGLSVKDACLTLSALSY